MQIQSISLSFHDFKIHSSWRHSWDHTFILILVTDPNFMNYIILVNVCLNLPLRVYQQ